MNPIYHSTNWQVEIDGGVCFVRPCWRNIHGQKAEVYVDLRNYTGRWHVTNIGYRLTRPPKFEGDSGRGWLQLKFRQNGRIYSSQYDNYFTEAGYHEGPDLAQFPWIKEDLEELMAYAYSLALEEPRLAKLLNPCIEGLKEAKGLIPSGKEASR